MCNSKTSSKSVQPIDVGGFGANRALQRRACARSKSRFLLLSVVWARMDFHGLRSLSSPAIYAEFRNKQRDEVSARIYDLD